MEFEILYAINNLHNPILDKIMIAITSLGNAGLIWIGIAVGLLFVKKTRKCGILMLISLALGLIIGNGFLKNIIARERPCWIDENIKLLPFTLYEIAAFIEYNECNLIYADNDYIENEKRVSPEFKPHFAYDNILSKKQN